MRRSHHKISICFPEPREIGVFVVQAVCYAFHANAHTLFFYRRHQRYDINRHADDKCVPSGEYVDNEKREISSRLLTSCTDQWIFIGIICHCIFECTHAHTCISYCTHQQLVTIRAYVFACLYFVPAFIRFCSRCHSPPRHSAVSLQLFLLQSSRSYPFTYHVCFGSIVQLRAVNVNATGKCTSKTKICMLKFSNSVWQAAVVSEWVSMAYNFHYDGDDSCSVVCVCIVVVSSLHSSDVHKREAVARSRANPFTICMKWCMRVYESISYAQLSIRLVPYRCAPLLLLFPCKHCICFVFIPMIVECVHVCKMI